MVENNKVTDEKFDKIDEKFGQLDKRFDDIDKRLKGQDEKFKTIDERFRIQDTKIDKLLAHVIRHEDMINNCATKDVITAGTTVPTSLVADTTALLGGSASLSTYINLGSSSNDTVTAGDLNWYDGSAIAAGSSGSIGWVNNTPNPLSGNSLSY